MRAVFMAVLAACLFAGSALAQAPMTLDAFVTRANRIPLNPTAMLRPDAHRLKGEAERAFVAVRGEVQAARAAGRRPATRQLLAFLNAIPQARRQRMTVTDGIREWMADRYPCPA
jgi:hypothetical protein